MLQIREIGSTLRPLMEPFLKLLRRKAAQGVITPSGI